MWYQGNNNKKNLGKNQNVWSCNKLMIEFIFYLRHYLKNNKNEFSLNLWYFQVAYKVDFS